MIKIMVVEDHEIFRKGIINLLNDIKDVEVMAEAENGKDFLEKIETIKPDIVFMDIRMPEIDGIEATKIAIAKNNKLKVIALSMHNEEDYLEKMLEAGAMGFLLKNATMVDIEKAIHSVMQGYRFFSEELMNILANKYIKKPEPVKEDSEFSKREIEVLQLICDGLTNHQIGEKLFISNRTVDGHRARMLEKIGAANTVGLVIYAIKNKLIKID
ncbi:MAG: response regulator transcription factor [Bacteroidales bacterium]|nr:response regulator transcription factor [Bacteroidales bacterium]